MKEGMRSSVTSTPLSAADQRAAAEADHDAEQGEPVPLMTVAARQADSADIGADREIEPGGQDDQRQARGHQEQQRSSGAAR